MSDLPMIAILMRHCQKWTIRKANDMYMIEMPSYRKHTVDISAVTVRKQLWICPSPLAEKLVAYEREFHTLRERLRVAEHRTLQRSSELSSILVQLRHSISGSSGSKQANSSISGDYGYAPCTVTISITASLSVGQDSYVNRGVNRGVSPLSPFSQTPLFPLLCASRGSQVASMYISPFCIHFSTVEVPVKKSGYTCFNELVSIISMLFMLK